MASLPASENSAAPNPPTLHYDRPAPSPTAVIWCRILALWILTYGLSQVAGWLIPWIALLFTNPSRMLDASNAVTLVFVVMPCVYFATAWYIWRKAPAIAARMVRDQPTSQPADALTTQSLLSILVVALGLYLLTEGLPPLVSSIYENYFVMRQGGQNYGILIIPGARCLIGLWLILGTGGVMRILKRHSGHWRDSSMPAPTPDEPPDPV